MLIICRNSTSFACRPIPLPHKLRWHSRSKLDCGHVRFRVHSNNLRSVHTNVCQRGFLIRFDPCRLDVVHFSLFFPEHRHVPRLYSSFFDVSTDESLGVRSWSMLAHDNAVVRIRRVVPARKTSMLTTPQKKMKSEFRMSGQVHSLRAAHFDRVVRESQFSGRNRHGTNTICE